MVLSVSVTGTTRAPSHLDSLLTKCGFLLRPAQEGGFIFRALYSGCFVQKEVGLGNYCFAVLRAPRYARTPGKCTTIELHIQLCLPMNPSLEHTTYVDQAGFEFTESYLPLPPKCWD